MSINYIVDGHCDTISKALDLSIPIFENNGKTHIEISKMNNNTSNVQFFAVFIEPKYATKDAAKRTLKILDYFYSQILANSQYIELATSYKDIINIRNRNKIASLLSIEGGEAIEGDLALLRMYYKLGVRSMTLTWNYRNQIADGIMDESTGGGLTSFGHQVIEEMERLGMIIDVSHIAEKGFWDVMKNSTTPIIASHSNVKALYNHPRNLTDKQMKAIANKGGLIGVSYCPYFMKPNGHANIDDVLDHINYIYKLVGIDYVGLGSDFDGVDKLPMGISKVSDIMEITKRLYKYGYKEGQIEKILGLNFMRIFKEVLT